MSMFEKISTHGVDFYWPMNLSKGVDWCNLDIIINEIVDIHNPHCYFKYYTPKSSDVVFDVGGCEGLFAKLIEGKVSNVHIFEPVNILCQAMKMTFEDSNNVYIHQVGVSNISGSMSFSITDDVIFCSGMYRESDNKLTIPVITIDDFVKEHEVVPTIIKIDIEGHEIEALYGAHNTLESYHPQIITCIYHEQNDRSEMMRYLAQFGYRFEMTSMLLNAIMDI